MRAGAELGRLRGCERDAAALRGREGRLQAALAEKTLENLELRARLASAREAASPSLAQVLPAAAPACPLAQLPPLPYCMYRPMAPRCARGHFVGREGHLAASQQEGSEEGLRVPRLHGAVRGGGEEGGRTMEGVHGCAQARQLLMDPAVAREFGRLRGEAEAQAGEVRALREELQGTAFSQDSKAGRLLMAKCRALQARAPAARTHLPSFFLPRPLLP